MVDANDRKYGIKELVQASGVSRRTIRYYVQRELLPPPEGAGRGHFYRLSHLERLNRIRDLQAQGRGLDEIRVLLDGSRVETTPIPRIDLAAHIPVAEGVELVVHQGAQPPTPSQLRALAAAAARILKGRNKP